LNPDLNYKQSIQLVEQDWIRDLTKFSAENKQNSTRSMNNNNSYDKSSLMSYNVFYSSLFELIDNWTIDCELSNYIDFLDKIIKRITVKIKRNNNNNNNNNSTTIVNNPNSDNSIN